VTDPAATWHAAMKRAGHLDPARIALAIRASADTGLRAARYDADGGGRSSAVPCPDEHCEDGPAPHSHPVTSDPTGNAATRGRGRDSGADDLARMDRAVRDMIDGAGEVLDWVVGQRPQSWSAVVAVNARLMPGTVQAGLDVDDEGHLYAPISKVDRAVATVERIARDHLPRTASQDEQHWTAGLADEAVCAWHLAIHRRYRRPRVGGTNVCASCLQLSEVLGAKPPTWLLEAEVDRESRPKAWTAALSRCMDELGVVRDRSA
jgi:hypothetical protein